MSKKLIYSIIPARGGSKGVPGKNIKMLNGHPLIAYSIKASMKSENINRTIISTESDEIAEISKRYGAEVPFLRPSSISSDNSTDTEFVLHALKWFEMNEGTLPDYLVHLRPTTPLRDFHLIDEAIKEFQNDDSYTALRSAHEMSESAYKTFEIEDGIFKTAFSRLSNLDASNIGRQAFPKTFSPNGYVDILKSRFVLENKLIHGNKVKALITPRLAEVDTIEDFDLLEYLIHKNNLVYKQLFEE